MGVVNWIPNLHSLRSWKNQSFRERRSRLMTFSLRSELYLKELYMFFFFFCFLRSLLHTLKSYVHGHLDIVICNMVWCLVACHVEISKSMCGLTNSKHTLNYHQISLSANYCKFFCWPSSPSNASGAFSVICILHCWPATKVVAIEEIA